MRRRLPKAEHRCERVVHSPQLLAAEVACEVAKAADVDGSGLFNKNAGRLTANLHLWAERRRASAARGRSDEDHRARKQLVGLDDHGETITVLFMADAFGELQAINITADHAVTP